MKAIIKDNGLFKTILALTLLTSVIIYAAFWIVTCSHILKF